MTNATISDVFARRVWDSRGKPTVEVDVVLDDGTVGRAIAPAGASRGSREALDLRDGGKRLNGNDVQNAINAVNREIGPAIRGMDVTRQNDIDRKIIELDGTTLKSRLGGNACVATSLAVLHAAANAAGSSLWRYVSEAFAYPPSLPLPEIQIFGGGAHAGRRIDIQDFMVMVPGASSFREALEVTSEIYHAAGAIMAERGRLCGVADEGGWWPDFRSNEEALDVLMSAIEMAGEKPGDRVVISLDVAASEFFANGVYRLSLEDRELDSGELIEMLGKWLDSYPVASIEDPLSELDKEGMQAFTRAYGNRVQVVGDDYLVTNDQLVEKASLEGACNTVLIKVNQAGTVSEAVRAFKAASHAGWQSIVSARSGETEDVSISHLAVGLNAGQLKVGSFARSERMAKWNECLRIEEELGTDKFVAGTPLKNTWWSKQ